MKNIKIMLLTAVTFLGLTSLVSAASLNGVYLELSTSAVGVEGDATVNEADSDITTGAVGKTAVTVSYGLGYMTARSNKLGLDIGYMWQPGEAKIKNNGANSVETSFEVSDTQDYYIAPMLNITEDASLYLKFGFVASDIKVVGDVNKPTSMDGETVAVGTIMSWGSNLYIRTEAGMTEYDKLTFTGLGNTISTSESATVNPKVNYGKIAIGYKF
tara:strand:+ start:521 stop:1165 length:645 start_codon:yes stop_codon:yes gene_type:complete